MCRCFHVGFDVMCFVAAQIDIQWHNKYVHPALTSSTRTITTKKVFDFVFVAMVKDQKTIGN